MINPSRPSLAVVGKENLPGYLAETAEHDIPDCPADAPDCVRKVWESIAPKIARLKLTYAADQAPLFAYLDSYSKFLIVSEALKSMEDMTETTPNGYKQMSQAFHIRSRLWKEVMEGAREFGHTPSARSRSKTPVQLDMGDFGGL